MHGRHAAALVAAVLLMAPPAGAAEVKLKIATQAPEGTVWLEAVQNISKTVWKKTRKSGNGVKFIVFPNGQMGDEKAVIEKMKTSLQGGLFTGIGLGEILPKARILEVPFLYENKAEIDAVRNALEGDFKKDLDAQGYVFLGWAEVGWAYIFSKVRAANLKELRKLKIWRWQGDPLAEAVFKAFQLNPNPLALTDVMTQLNTPGLDAVYNSPYGLIGLQWDSKIKYMSRMTVGHGTGALLVSKKAWTKIKKKYRKRIAKLARKKLDRLLDDVRKKNEEAVATLKDNGVRIIPIPAEEMPMYKKLGNQVADDLAGPDKMWSRALLARVRKIIADKRAQKK